MEYTSSAEKLDKMCRSYSLSSEDDFKNIENGRCPNYALSWGDYNKYYWKPDHDYIIGNNYIKNQEVMLRKILQMEKTPKIYCELEGVLTDFNNTVHKIFSEYPDKLDPKKMWKKLANTPNFFENLEWLEEGRKLWNAIEHLNPIILTICPHSSSNPNWIEIQKRNWCLKHLGPQIEVITYENQEEQFYYNDPPDAIVIIPPFSTFSTF